MPLVPHPDNDQLKECFHRHSTAKLSGFHGVKVCGTCHSKTLTRDQVMDLFDFTKSQADQIKRRVGNSVYGGIKYIYDLDTVAKAVKKRNGSLFSLLATSAGCSPQTTGDGLKAATTKAKKQGGFRRSQVFGRVLSQVLLEETRHGYSRSLDCK